jgi:hypothetical protein
LYTEDRTQVFTGLLQGTIKVLIDPEAQSQLEDVEPSKSVSEGEGDDIPTPSDDQIRTDPGTALSGTQSANREEKMETGPSLN